MDYQKRLIDDEIDEVISDLPAVAIEGAKGVGKTATASHHASHMFSLDDSSTSSLLEGDPKLILRNQGTTLIDEWQRLPQLWDIVRRAVDDGAQPGRFLLTGSATPNPKVPIHSGAGRIVRLFMRPMSLPERRFDTPSVSLASLLAGGAEIDGQTARGTSDYVYEIMASGFPGIRKTGIKAQAHLLEGYVEMIIDREIPELGEKVRRPASLLNWLTSYASATATTASYSSLLNASTPGETEKPSKPTAITYRDLLQRMWILDPLPAWIPISGTLHRLGQSPKHHLVDPALAAHLAGVTHESLIQGEGPSRGHAVFLGALFESLAVQTVRVLAQFLRAKVSHLRTQGGDHEIDLIVQRRDHKVLAIEIKLASHVRPSDVAQLNWLQQKSPDLVIDKVLLNTGPLAYRRQDGVAVIPLALLGP